MPRTTAALHEEFRSVAARHDVPEFAAAAVRGLRRQELLRIACADLLGMLDVEAVGEALSDVADATVSAALQIATAKVTAQRGTPLDALVTVVGMGRLGGHEQGYGSDADVMFVHEPLPGVADADAALTAKQVAEELRRLLALPAPDPPLVVDADLRPEGKQGPLTLSLSGYARYYAGRAAVWEAQALLRARVVAGDAGLGERFEQLIAPVRWPEAFPDASVTEVRRVKARVENERLSRGVESTGTPSSARALSPTSSGPRSCFSCGTPAAYRHCARCRRSVRSERQSPPVCWRRRTPRCWSRRGGSRVRRATG